MPHKQKTTVKEKVQFARVCVNGEMSVREAGLKACVSPSTTKGWIRRYKADGVATSFHMNATVCTRLN